MSTTKSSYKSRSLAFQIVMALLLFFTIKVTYAQSYIPMLNSHAEWHVTNCNSGCATDKYYTIGDTIINGLHYTFLDLFHYNKNFVIREDTIGKKVYMRLLADPPPAKDYLLYDFSLQVQDTVSITNPGSPYPKYPGNFVVDSIKLKSLVNKNTRHFYLHSEDTLTSNTKTTVWVEGIGSLCLINTPGAMPQINGAGQLSCFFNNNINEYKQLDSIADCISIYPVGINELKNNLLYHVAQNFDSKTVSISGFNSNAFKIKIYSVNGKLELSEETMNDNRELYIGSLTKGLLLLKIENKEGAYSNHKLFNP